MKLIKLKKIQIKCLKYFRAWKNNNRINFYKANCIITPISRKEILFKFNLYSCQSLC